MPTTTAASLSLRRRVVLVVVVLAVLLGATSVAALIGQNRSDAATARVTEQALPALVAVERMQRGFVDEQTGIRGYLLTGQDALLEPYRGAAGLIAEQEDVLRTALADDPAALGQLDTVLRGHRAWLDVTELAIGLRAQGRPADLDELIDRGRGATLFAVLRADVDGMRAVIQRRTAAEIAHLALVRAALTAVLIGAAGVGVLGAVLAVVGIRRSVSRPLGALVDAVERVADGDLDRPVPTGGPPEFAVLGGAVDRMRVMLNDQRRSAVRVAELDAELRESDRVAAELRDGAVRRLLRISTELTALTGRHPHLAGELARPIGELDQAVAEVRAAAVGGDPAGPDGADPLASRVAAVLARAPELLGVHPDLRIEQAPGLEVPGSGVDALVDALDQALVALVETRARLEVMEVELAVTERGAALCVTANGVVPGEWTSTVRDRASRFDGICRVVDLDPDLTVVEWTVPLAGADRR